MHALSLQHDAIAALRDLSTVCEASCGNDLAAIYSQFIALTANTVGDEFVAVEMMAEVERLVALGEIESAALRIIPASVDLTSGLFENRTSIVAQAIISKAGASHSRAARRLGMAWLAAYFRALAQLSENQ